MTPPPDPTPTKSTRPRPRPKRKIVENGLFKTVPAKSFYDAEQGAPKTKRRALSVVTASDPDPEITITEVVTHEVPSRSTQIQQDTSGKEDVAQAARSGDGNQRKRRRETESPLTPLPDEITITLPRGPTPPLFSPAIQSLSSAIDDARRRSLSICWTDIMAAASTPVVHSPVLPVLENDIETNALGLVISPVQHDSARDIRVEEESDDDEGDVFGDGIWDLVLPMTNRRRTLTPPEEEAVPDERVMDVPMDSPASVGLVLSADAVVPVASTTPSHIPLPPPDSPPTEELNVLLADLSLDPDLPIAGITRRHALSDGEVGCFVAYVGESVRRGVDDLGWLSMRYRRYVSTTLLHSDDLATTYHTTTTSPNFDSAYPPRLTRCAACRGSSPSLDCTQCCTPCQTMHSVLRHAPGEWARYVAARREVVQVWEMQVVADLESQFRECPLVEDFEGMEGRGGVAP